MTTINPKNAARKPSARRRTRSAALRHALAMVLASGAIAAAHADGDPRIAASRDYAARLQQALGAHLKAALAESGPVGAIDVCRVEAPQIAQQLAEPGGPVSVGRTALRVRNPANTADEPARAVLERFAQAADEGRTEGLMDFTARSDGSARYMQPIWTQPLCLACHGTALAPEVMAALAEAYPEDQAIGFADGELRGAFIVEWPARESYRD